MFMAAADQTLLATATPAMRRSLERPRDSPGSRSAICWSALPSSRSTAGWTTPTAAQYAARRSRGVRARFGRLRAGAVAAAARRGTRASGIGGGGLMTLSQAIIGELVPPVERVRFQGYFALVFTTAS